MRNASLWILGKILLVVFASATAFGQAGSPTTTLIVNGRSGNAAVVQQTGRTYVDVSALARIANGTISFGLNRIVLSIPPPATSASPEVETPHAAADDSHLSREFMKAGIEQIASLREWGAAVGNAVQNGYPIQEQWVANYREQAAQVLRQASVAASTTGDKNALQLLTNEFDGVRQWSNQLVEASKNMATAKYSMSPGSLREEPQAQKLIACWHFLGSMLGSGSFQDESSCH